MQISVPDPKTQTILFSLVLLVLLSFGIRRKNAPGFGIKVTNELKGFAILTVIFGHIGYFLSTDPNFLFPLSILSGVGVNLFLVLSGYGLTASALKKRLSIFAFYQKRLKKIFIPLWAVIVGLLFLDAFVLGKTYSSQSVIGMFAGWFPQANLYQNIDSPLWYFSFIFFYYLLFPFVSFKRLIYLCPLTIYLISYLLLKLPLPVYLDPGVRNLYLVHLGAFPLGCALALLTQLFKKRQLTFARLESLRGISLLSWVVMPLLFITICYFAFNSGVGVSLDLEERISILTTFCLMLLFILKKTEFKLFSLFGIYSYEIYLIHWPILYRYDIFYRWLPAWIATISYLLLFIILGKLFAWINAWVDKKLVFE